MRAALLRLVFGALARLPLWGLYGCSSFVFFVLFHVLGYRRKVVDANLARAFPAYTPQERRRVARNFYARLCDMIVETVKMLHMPAQAFERRFMVDVGILQALHAQGRSPIVVLAHQFNWEWGAYLLNAHTPYVVQALYAPLKDKQMDALIRSFRQRCGTTLIPMGAPIPGLTEPAPQPTLTLFLADQNPGNDRRLAWVPFFGQPTAFHNGYELLARKTGQPVVFAEIVRQRRGHFAATFTLAFDQPRGLPAGTIVAAYAQFLEASICRHPANWLWSHKRWKRNK